MEKLTRKVYQAKIQELKDQLGAAQTRLDQLMAIDDSDRSESENNEFNPLYDQIADIEDAIRDLEFDWAHRGWTQDNWNSYALAIENRD